MNKLICILIVAASVNVNVKLVEREEGKGGLWSPAENLTQ